MAKVKYVCEELTPYKTIYGNHDCKNWVMLQESTSNAYGLAISKQDAYVIGAWLFGIFGMCLLYVCIAKAIKIA